MAHTTSVNIRMDSELKKQFELFCADMGMTMTVAFTIFAKKAVREYRIPFEIGAEKPNAATLAAMEAAEKGEMFGPFDSVDQMMEALDA